MLSEPTSQNSPMGPAWRARAFSERANSGVGHCGRTRGRNHPPYPDLGFGG